MSRAAAVMGPLALALAFACSEGDYQLERRGGPFPAEPVQDPPLGSAGNPAVDPAGGAPSTGGAVGGGAISFCEALNVVRAKCQRCHTDPTENGAPVPFLTFEDFHAIYFADVKWWQRAQQVVESNYMPYVALSDPPTSLMPPVEPLTADEKATLMGWFMQGALPEGGTDCP